MSEEQKLPVHVAVVEIDEPADYRDCYLVNIRDPSDKIYDPLTPKLFDRFARSDASVEINIDASAGQRTTEAAVEIATLARRRVREVHFTPAFGPSGGEMCTLLHAIVTACDPDRQIVVHTHTRDGFDVDFQQVPARVDMVFNLDLQDLGLEIVVKHDTQYGPVLGYAQTGLPDPDCLSNLLTRKWKIFAAEREKAKAKQ